MKKKYDAVKEMRSIRDRITKEQIENPTKREQRLKQIRKKHSFKKSQKVT
ncbi:MAG: hypothetical protein ABI638_02940 [Ignavibacteriota bacterium]